LGASYLALALECERLAEILENPTSAGYRASAIGLQPLPDLRLAVLSEPLRAGGTDGAIVRAILV